jgi:hypothetical protein
MDYDAQVTEFLSKRENLLFVFEIAERLEDVKDKFQKEFWLGVQDVIQRRLRRSRLTGKWELYSPNESELSGTRWIPCNLYPTTCKDEDPYLGLGLQQNASGQFVYGVWWHNPVGKKTRLEPVKRLAKVLNSEGFDMTYDSWLGKKILDLAPRSKEFVLRMVAGKHIVIEEMADLLWTLFESKHTMIEAANRALAKQ